MINVVVLAGNIVKDPNVRTTGAGSLVSTVRLAVNNPLNDKETLFIDVEAWDKQAEFVQKYVKKGSAVSVTGRLKIDQWEKEGVKNSKPVVVASQMNFISTGKKRSETGASNNNDDEDVPYDTPAPTITSPLTSYPGYVAPRTPTKASASPKVDPMFADDVF